MQTMTEKSEMIIKYECFKNKIPVIRKGTYVHMMPDKNYIHSTSNLQKTRYIFENRTMTTINDDAVQLLELCDGTRNIEEIVNIILSRLNEYKWEKVTDSILKFIYYSVEIYRNIELMDDKIKDPIKLEKTGSKEHMLPQHFVMELTTRCNLKCKHCYRYSSPDIEDEEIPYEKAMSVLEEMYHLGGRFIEITGGEPFLHSRIKDILTYAGEKYNFVGLLTNGTLVKNDMIDYLEKYKDKIIWNISLDSCNEEFHDEFRGKKGAFKKTSNTIKKLSERGFTVRTAISISEGNIKDFEDTVEYIRNDLKSTFLGYSYVMPLGRGKEILWEMEPGLREKRIMEINKFTDQDKYRGFISKSSMERVEDIKKNETNCGAGWRSFAIAPDGIVRPCVMMHDGFINLGDINKNSITDIMKQELINFLYKLPWPMEGECIGCANELYCRWCAYRGCMVNAERKKQGVEICEWARKNNVDQYIDLDTEIENDKHCKDILCSKPE